MTTLWTRGYGYGNGFNVRPGDGHDGYSNRHGNGGNGYGGNGLGNGLSNGGNGYGNGFGDGDGVGDGDSVGDGDGDGYGYPEQDLPMTPVVCRVMTHESTLALSDLLILALAS